MSSCEPALYISSNDLDYSIVLKRYRRYSKELVDRILPHMSRMRHLCIPWTHLHDDDGNVSQLLSTLIDAPGPQLETFNLYRGRADGRCFALPAIFGGHTPRLSILKLCYSFPRMGSVSFTNLKELYIRGRKRDLITMELSQIMEILEAAPALEYFVTVKARFVQNQALEDDNQQVRQVRLDSLRRFDMARWFSVYHSEPPQQAHRPQLPVSYERLARAEERLSLPLRRP